LAGWLVDWLTGWPVDWHTKDVHGRDYDTAGQLVN
jgi:hypothetical protein